MIDKISINNSIRAFTFILTMVFSSNSMAILSCEEDSITLEDALIKCPEVVFSNIGDDFLYGYIKSSAINIAFSTAFDYLATQDKKVIKTILGKKYSKKLFKGSYKKIAKKLSSESFSAAFSISPSDVAFFILKEFSLMIIEVNTNGTDTPEYIIQSYLLDQAFIVAKLATIPPGGLWLYTALSEEATLTASQIYEVYKVAKIYYSEMDSLEASVLENYILGSYAYAESNYMRGSPNNKAQELQEILAYMRNNLFKDAGIEDDLMAKYFTNLKSFLVLLEDKDDIVSIDRKDDIKKIINDQYDLAYDLTNVVLFNGSSYQDTSRFCYFQSFMFTGSDWDLLNQTSNNMFFCGYVY